MSNAPEDANGPETPVQNYLGIHVGEGRDKVCMALAGLVRTISGLLIASWMVGLVALICWAVTR